MAPLIHDSMPCQACREREGLLYKIVINGLQHYLNICVLCLIKYDVSSPLLRGPHETIG